MSKPNTTNYTLAFSKNFGKLWMLDDITPFYRKFQSHFDEKMGHDLLKLTVIGAANQVLDILAGDDKEMKVDLVISDERTDLPGYVEFELVAPGSMAAKYHVNNCPGMPQLVAWSNASVKEIVKTYPTFAYIKKMA